MRQAAREAKAPGKGADWPNQRLIQYGLYKQFLSSSESCAGTVIKRLNGLTQKDSQNAKVSYLKRLSNALKGLALTESSRFELLAQLDAIGWTGKANSSRILVFTEYVATQQALALAIAAHFRLRHSEKIEAQAKQAIAFINGAYSDIHLMAAVEAFGTQSAPVRIMIATDVASEGINLHYQCHHVIHYDLPWSGSELPGS